MTGARDAFLARFGHVYEHSAWVAERAFERGPAMTLDALHAAFQQVVAEATPSERLALLRAHPRLADRLTMASGMTPDSVAEQASAGLDQLSAEEFSVFLDANERYEARFGFPFIICARLHSKEQIMTAMASRLAATPAAEIDEALAQVAQITRLRLADALSG